MISLKKNDKIIIVVAVVILVIAGAGVAMYQSPKPKIKTPLSSTSGKGYTIIWTERNGSLETISEFAGKKSQYAGSLTIPKGNLKSITFNLTWTDDKMTLLKRRGLDSLTLDVAMPDRTTFTELKTSAPITGKGMITFTKEIGIRPPVSINISDETVAKAKLKEKPYYDDSWINKDIKINVSVKIGESPIRILRYFLDKGNNFELKITYQYLEGALKEDTTKSTAEDPTLPPEDPIPPYLSMIISTGCGRYI